jgi:uncharacterized protein (TIGR03067 family)
MPLTHIAAVLGITLAAQQQPPMPIDPALRLELMKLQGSWQIDALEENGKKTDAEQLKGHTLLFANDNLLVRGPDKFRQTAVLKFGIAKSPKTINVTVVQGPDRGTTMLGIYTFDGDTLRICLDLEGEVRPKEFTAPAESKRKLMTCKRLRAKDELDLIGTYRSVAMGFDGQEYLADAIIDKLGDGYTIQYKINGQPAYVGVGLRKGNAMSMYWLNQGQPGITVYQIEPGPRLVGRYMQLSGAGILEEEILTRVHGKQQDATPSPDAGR